MLLRRLFSFAFLGVLALFAGACDRGPDPQQIVDRAVAAHGGDELRNAVITFDFRGRQFKVTRQDGRFRYERTYTDSTGRVYEVLSNDSLYREVDGVRVALSEAERQSMETAVNSVVYFALLPVPLNDPAVRKRYLGEATVEGAPYHKVEVTFDVEGGGRDHDDRFVYWIHRDDHTVDYLAYRFHVNGGGTRFRKAYNPRVVGGFRFVDHLNFTADTLTTAIERYDEVLAADALVPYSDIVLENVDVRPLAP